MATYNNTGPVHNIQGNTNDINSYVSVYHSAPPEPTSITFDVQSPEINFVGRSVMLRSIADAMKPSLNSSNILVISGLGGVGKSQLIRKFIQENRPSYQHVIWIDSEKSESINESFKRLASIELNISLFDADGRVKESNAIIVQVLNKLCKSKTLCVLDNVNKIETVKFVLTIEPSGIKPHVLITSRIQEWSVGIKVMQLNDWEFDEAMKYVTTALKNYMDTDNDKKSLVEKLQRFPLVLRQATSYINYQRRERRLFRITDYLDKIDASYQDTKEMLGCEIFKEDAYNNYEETTLTTWRITIDAIKEYGATGRLAVRILNIIAYFDTDNIRRDIFNHITDTFEENIKSAVRLLINYSMVNSMEPKDQSVLSIHRLVQLIIRLDLTETHRDKSTLRDALDLISKLIEVKHIKLNVSHLISVFLSALKFDDLVQEFSTHPGRILKTLLGLRKYNQAIAFGNETLKALERIIGADHPDTLTTKHNLASSYATIGKCSEAIRMNEDVLEKRELILGADHPDTLKTKHSLASSYAKLEKDADAIRMYEEVIEKRELILGGYHPHTLATKHNLARSYANIREYSDAIRMHKEVLEKRELILEADHPHTITTRNDLASLYADLGKHPDAIRIYEEVIEKRELILGAYHPHTLATKNNLALSYANIGNDSGAIRLYEEVLQKREMILAEDHPDTLATRNNLALSYANIGKHSDAIRMYEKVLEKVEFSLGGEHRHTLTTKHNLANSYAELGKHSDAIRMYEEVLEKRELILGADHPDTLRTKNNLASSYLDIGKHSNAIRMYDEV